MFTGFTPESIDFLWGIRLNNNREWFQDNKKTYVEHLYEPMKALGQALFQPFLNRSGDLLKVSRIYRDARLHHPDPYKESLWLCIRQDVQWWAENPCLFLEINPEGVDYGFLLWKPSPASMERFRREIAARPDDFLAALDGVEQATGMTVTAECYKRPKAASDPKLARFFGWKSQIALIRHVDPGEELFRPELAQQVADFFAQLLPLYDYFNHLKDEHERN